MIKKLVTIAFIGFLISVVLMHTMYRQMNEPLAVESAVLFEVKAGDTMNSLSQRIKQQQWLANRFWLRSFVRLNPEYAQIKQGTYLVKPGDSTMELLKTIVEGKEHQFTVTLIEGLTLKQWLVQLRQQSGLKITDNTKDVESVVSALALKEQNPEGLFLPETYAFTQGTQDIEILKRANKAMSETLDDLWQARASNLPYKTAYQALIMASIIEKETGRIEEQATISSVFVNRLNKKMRLQTDPTVIYGMGENYNGNITKKDLKQLTPYNTYRINGLPPTPIAMPGIKAIEAALHPAKTNLYYFVAKGDGSHYFSKTLAEHNAAVRKYQLGIK